MHLARVYIFNYAFLNIYVVFEKPFVSGFLEIFNDNESTNANKV